MLRLLVWGQWCELRLVIPFPDSDIISRSKGAMHHDPLSGSVLYVDPNNHAHSFTLRLRFLVTFFALSTGALKCVYRRLAGLNHARTNPTNTIHHRTAGAVPGCGGVDCGAVEYDLPGN